MFPKKIKKQETKLIDNDKDDNQYQYKTFNQHPQIDKSITKLKRLKKNKSLKKSLQQIMKDKEISLIKILLEDQQALLILNKKLKNQINQWKNMFKKISKMLIHQLSLVKLKIFKMNKKEMLNFQKKLERHQPNCYQKIKKKIHHFMLVVLFKLIYLWKEAQKLAQMEDLKRDQYIQTIIQGKPKRAAPIVVHPDEEKDKETKAFRELKSKFYQKGRTFKYQQMKYTIDNIQPEIEQSQIHEIKQ